MKWDRKFHENVGQKSYHLAGQTHLAGPPHLIWTAQGVVPLKCNNILEASATDDV